MIARTAREERENRFTVVRSEDSLGRSSALQRMRKETDQIVVNIGFADRQSTELDWDLAAARKISTQLASGYEVVLVEDERVDATWSLPDAKEARRPIPGRLRVRAFLYAYAPAKVVCASNVDVTNSREAEVRFSLSRPGGLSSDVAAGLREDLTTNAMVAAEANMVAVGPRSVGAP